MCLPKAVCPPKAADKGKIKALTSPLITDEEVLDAKSRP